MLATSRRRGLVSAFALLVLSPVIGLAAEPTVAAAATGWTTVRTIDAPEAHQAAAAHEDWAFAITNNVVAKYDRETGKRLAVSTGAAKHLNSGFVWNGKLHCAHSNYPRKPEQSEIKVLDLATMELSNYKEFGNYGGSLTWAVRHEDAWWCNFALYGDDNAKTFLVKCDDDWRELARWTYPAEILRSIGRNSLSGGLWHGGVLLVTDHDHPVIYRLRLPKEGSVLEFIDKVPAPFSGQGFALDPHTGGLIGINRAKRQIVLAEPK